MRDESCKGSISRADSRGVEEQAEDRGFCIRSFLQALTERLGGDAGLLTSLFMVGLMSTNLADRVQEKE